MTELMLVLGADVNARTNWFGKTPLMYAAENASPALIRLLLDAGADAAAADSKGNPVRWYLERNTRLRAPDKASLRARMTR